MKSYNTFYVASGFSEDAKNLIAQFLQVETFKFQGFTEIWNAANFSFVFSGRKTRSELLEFCEEALDIAKEFLSPKKNYKERIGGIYLLYGIYFRMPIQGPKIRMILTDWENLLTFQTQLYNDKQYDAIYILQRLTNINAFSYCLSEQELGLENYYVIKDFMKINSGVVPSVKKDSELVTILNNIKRQSEIYIQAKDNLEKITGVTVPKLFKISEIFLPSQTDINNTESETENCQESSEMESEQDNIFATTTNDSSNFHVNQIKSSPYHQTNFDSTDDSESDDG